MTKKKETDNPRGLSGKTIFKINIVYWVLCAMFSTLTYFTVAPLMSGTGIGILVAAGFIVPALATMMHVRKGKKDRIDEIAKRL